MATAFPEGLRYSLCAPKVSLRGGSSNTHQLPRGHGENWSIKKGMKNRFPDAASGVQTPVPLTLINLTWKSHREGKRVFQPFQFLPFPSLSPVSTPFVEFSESTASHFAPRSFSAGTQSIQNISFCSSEEQHFGTKITPRYCCFL